MSIVNTRFLDVLRARWARYRVHRSATIDISPHAKVDYRALRRHAGYLRVGEGSIVEGRVVSDRQGSVVSIGRNTFIGGSTIVCAERIEIGDDVLISWGCTIVDHDSHALLWRDRRDDVRDWFAGKKDWSAVTIKPVSIRDKAWIGFNTIVLKGVTIGEGAVVGAGSVVTRDVAPFTVVAGNPARVIRSLDHE